METSDINVSRFEEIKTIIHGLAVNSGLTIEESIFIIERSFEKVFFNEYTVQFDDKYELYATDSEHTYYIKSMMDVKRLRHQAFLKITETRKKYVNNLKSNISLKEIADIIADETNKLAVLNAYTQFNHLIFKHVRGFILNKIDGGYIVNIGINKIAYFYTDQDYELHKDYIFFVKSIIKEPDTGTIKIILNKTKKNKKILDVYEVFKNHNGKIVKNKIAIRATNDFIWVFELRHRETLYRKQINRGDQTARELALLAAKRVFDAYAFGSQSRAEGT